MVSTKQLYDEASGDWRRSGPVLLSDYTARPFLLQWCEPATNCDVLDLGCGEGYFARNLKERGARTILGVDISSEMIRSAQEREAGERLGIEYVTGDATSLRNFGDNSFDLVVAVFLFNYLTLEETRHTMREVFRVLRPGGRFVFAVPHPALAFLGQKTAPFYFDPREHGYYSGRDVQFEGEIWRRDGKSVPVRSVHKTVEDYMSGLADAGFERMPLIAELHVTDEHLALDPTWFQPLRDKPLHLAFQLQK
ncbi:MAG: class I SAM-dependent methyltransferase [Planctomycetes bacterium]|nr:class I SAM-dependent methyltransferase [Planctomycetota bacterium]